MNLNQYQALAMRTAKVYPTFEANLNHAGLGIASEFFELATAIEADQIREETGDLAWFVALGAQTLGITLSDLVEGDDPDANTIQACLPDVFKQPVPAILPSLASFTTFVKRVAVYGKQPDPSMLAAAILDLSNILLFCAAVAEQHGFTLAGAMRENIAKLKLRYPDKYSDDAAEARADKGGVSALSS